MKLRMPEFEEFELDTPTLNPEGLVPRFDIFHPYFEGRIEIDGPSTTDHYFMYGYIGEWYYDDAVVVSDDIDLEETADGMIEKSTLEKAYTTIVEQLKERYEKWAIENLVEE